MGPEVLDEVEDMLGFGRFKRRWLVCCGIARVAVVCPRFDIWAIERLMSPNVMLLLQAEHDSRLHVQQYISIIHPSLAGPCGAQSSFPIIQPSPTPKQCQ